LGSSHSPTSTDSSDVQHKVASFADWLARHGTLVKSMAICSAQQDPDQARNSNAQCWVPEALVQRVQRGLQLAAAGHSRYPMAAGRRTVKLQTATQRPLLLLLLPLLLLAAVLLPRQLQGLLLLLLPRGMQSWLLQSQPQRPQGLLLPLPPPQRQRQLGMASFSSNTTWANSLLPVLPAHSLTRLELQVDHSSFARDARASTAAALAAALPRLSSLQELVLKGDGANELNQCLSVLGQLRGLTRLELIDWDWSAWTHISVNQLLEQPPPLRVWHWKLGPQLASDELSFLLDMRDMQHLQEFVGLNGFDPVLANFPTQLQHLEVDDCYHSFQLLAAVTPLQQLTSLGVGWQRADASPVLGAEQGTLLQLAQLPALQKLRLALFSLHRAAATAPVWGQLPQLCELKLSHAVSWSDVSVGEVAAVFAGLAAATRITRLELDMSFTLPGEDVGDEEADEQHVGVEQAAEQHVGVGEAGEQHVAVFVAGGLHAPVDACASIAALVGLKHLKLSGLGHVIGDVLALTALTRLTFLGLPHGGARVGDTQATALATSLKELRHLDLSCCELGGMLCMEVIAGLPQLTELSFTGCPGVTCEGLMALTQLLCLQRLDVDRSDEVTDAVLNSFWAALCGDFRR
jgi:hypothetical protein